MYSQCLSYHSLVADATVLIINERTGFKLLLESIVPSTNYIESKQLEPFLKVANHSACCIGCKVSTRINT